MFRLSHKKMALRLSLVVAILAIAVISINILIRSNNNEAVNAVAGDRVSIGRVHIPNSKDDKINYGSGNNSDGGIGDGWTTRIYQITNPAGTTIRAYCAEPWQNDPTNTTATTAVYTEDNANAKEIKLIMYMNRNNAYSSQINTYYQNLGVGNDDNKKYAWTHAIIGYLYKNKKDTDGLSDGELTIVKNIISELTREINAKTSTWRIAQHYTVYEGINNSSGHQNVIWLEGSVQRGSITVQKCDSLSRECQVEGVNFGVYNNSGVTIYDPNGSTYANGAKITSAKTAANGKVTFSNLLIGFEYTVKEEATGTTNTSYALTAPDQNVSLTMTNKNPTLQFFNRPARGDVRFVKMDKNNNRPLANVLFSITPMYDGGTFGESHYVVSDHDGIVDTRSSFALHSNHTNGYDVLAENDEPISFQGFGTWFADKNYPTAAIDDAAGALPIGRYIIEELRCASNRFCYKIKDQKKIIEITKEADLADLGDWDNACAEYKLETEAVDKADEDHYIEAIKEAKIKDTISYCVKTDTDYLIKGILIDKSTGEPLLVDGKTIESSIQLNSEEECGTTAMYFDVDASELGGKDIVVFESLYYQDEEVYSHEDIDDESQTVNVVKITTTATNNETGEKVLPRSKDAKVRDLVQYCLKPGIEYTIKGVVMDKKTGNGLLVDSEPVEQSITFTPGETCGELEMFYDINATDLAGAELIIFESLYIGDDLIIEHKDINNESESFSVELPAPDTGTNTNHRDAGISGETITFVGSTIVLCLGGYITSRMSARKKFYK